MSRTPPAWISHLRRASTMLVVAGFTASTLAACGGADSGSGASSAAVAASAAIASAMAGSEAAASDAANPTPAAASSTDSSDDSSQNGFTDAQACTWAKQELVALRKVNTPDIAQVNILTSLSDFLNKHGGFSDEIKQGTEVDEATQRACPTQHDELLKKADLKSLGDLP